jgi:3-demethoxyubiquinol 3-hydroxylase
VVAGYLGSLGLMELSARLNSGESLGDRVLMVNHAGEHGAVNIYTGQLLAARLSARALRADLAEFRTHEERHRAIFFAELQRRGLAQCRNYLLCGFGGFMLGLINGLFGPSAIAATTVAVERVVLRHLDRQLLALQGKDEAAVRAIRQILSDERAHHDRSASVLKLGRFWPTVLSPVVARSTEFVIWVGMHS